jgi:hypothetical protein
MPDAIVSIKIFIGLLRKRERWDVGTLRGRERSNEEFNFLNR